jgi:hypothetical protein
LGGNARTFLIATVSPSRSSAEETISTLKFADNAKQVLVQATINETRPVDHVMVQKLQGEVERLRAYVRRVGGEGVLTALSLPATAADSAATSADLMVSLQGMSSAPSTTAALMGSLELTLHESQDRVAFLSSQNESLARELVDSGVLVNCIAPVITETDLLLEMTPEHISSAKAKIPMGRFLTIDEIAAMVAWIAGPECSFSTGFTFDLSGGRATY